jgi:hypothetical protein
MVRTFSRVPAIVADTLYSAKVPAIMYSSITNLLIFHRFLDDNENYRSLTNKPLKAKIAPIVVTSTEDGEDDAGLDKEPDVTKGLGFDFGPISEPDLSAGVIVKDRLLKLLDHPMLKNHLLKNKNMLPLIVSTSH